jgi:hypothetical protein
MKKTVFTTRKLSGCRLHKFIMSLTNGSSLFFIIMIEHEIASPEFLCQIARNDNNAEPFYTIKC